MTLRADSLICGRWITGSARFPVTDPATDDTLADVAALNADQVRDAIDAAWDAWASWRATAAADRASKLNTLSSLMLRDAERLAELMTREQGKPLAEARGEIAYGAAFLDHAAGEATRHTGEVIPAPAPNKRVLALRQPVGPAAIITPWNFPIAMIARKLGPALGAGCTAIVKPAEQTPLSAIALGELTIEAGFPPGVVNIVTGDAPTIGAALLGDPRIRKLSFTGSTEIGRLLMRGGAENLLRLSLELGGHAPFLVFGDADLDAAVAGAVAAKFRNAGQTCICPNRFYVHEDLHDAFVERLAERAGALRVGRGLDAGTEIGPLIDDAGVAKAEAHVEDAVRHGAAVVCGGGRLKIDGLADRFLAPTVLTGMTHEMRLAREETFGPVAPVASFTDDDEAVRLANDSPYGLAAYVYTRDLGRATRAAEALEHGIVGVNDGAPSTPVAPFGGVKHSGFGREGGPHVMHEYTEIKYVSLGL